MHIQPCNCKSLSSAEEALAWTYINNIYTCRFINIVTNIVQELCESRGGRPGLSVLTSLLVSVEVKLY